MIHFLTRNQGFYLICSHMRSLPKKSCLGSNFFKTVQLESMGIVFTGFALLWLYMFWAQFFVTWFGNLPYETGPLWTRMFGHYAPYFWVMMFCVFWLPFGALIFAPVKRNWWSLLLVAAVINVGVWINRYGI